MYHLCPFSHTPCRREACAIYHAGYEKCSIPFFASEVNMKLDTIVEEVRELKKKVQRL